MDEENQQYLTTAKVIPTINKDDTGKTFDLDDDDEAAIIIESDDLVAIDVGDAEQMHDQLPSVEEMKTRSSTDPSVVAANRARTQKRCLLGFGSIFFVAMLLVAIVVPVKNNKSKSAGTSYATLTGRTAEVIDFLFSEGVSPLPALKDLYMAEHRAAAFVADGDLYQIEMGPKMIERYVLSLFYYYFDGPDWTYSYNFLSARDHCEWHRIEQRPEGTILKGVKCNEEGYVTGLDLSDNKLHGKHMPDEIQWLKQIEAFHIQKNHIGGQIPPSFSKLNKLKSLGMMDLGLSGTIPEFFGSMTALTTLALSKNDFYGSIPASFSKLSNIRLLGLDGNNLSGNINPLKSLNQLEALFLSDNKLTGQIENASWGKVKEFDVSNNMLDGTIPSSMINNPNMVVFDIGHNLFYGQFPKDIKSNDALQYLNLHGNVLTGTLSDRIGYLSNLKHFDVGEMNLTGYIPDTLSQLKKLEYLYTSGNPFSPQRVPSLQELANLRDLQMKGNHLTGALPDWLAELTSLQLLDLDSNELSGSIPTYFGLLRNLHSLLLNRNKISGSIPSELANMKSLKILLLDGNDLTGGADAICKAESSGLDLAHFIADCYPGQEGEAPELECRCCTMCCSDSDPNCNNKKWTANYDPEYQYGFFRPKYTFSLDGATMTQFSKDGNESSSEAPASANSGN
jgi:Leucine-rich repeat (LRR) protein